MFHIFIEIALGWATLLLVACVPRLIRSDDGLSRILALETLLSIMVILLCVFSLMTRNTFYLDSALVLALLGFTGTVAATIYYRDQRVL